MSYHLKTKAACNFTINHDDHKLTEHQATVLTAFTGLMIGKFGAFHEYAEKLLGRPVLTHEFTSQEMSDRLKELSKEDFLNLQP